MTNKANLEASNELFIHLVEEAHKRGMKVILDGVFNHCGSFNKWLDRERIYEAGKGYEPGAYVAQDSPYHTFFKFYNEHNWPYNEFYDGWWGHDTLPKLNYEGSEKLMEDIMRIGAKWVSPPFNADGWRLDVAADLGHSPEFNHKFWKEFRRVVKEANPEAILMLVFKDSILGFVAGIQLSANDMVRPGDWITLPSGAANGTVQEITLNTVKIQNFDNTISTVPPYTLVSSPFQNWRGMKDSGGRRVMKNITLDLTTLQFCTPEMLDRYRKEIPLMADYQPEEGVVPTNSQVYRVYIERYLCSLPVVNQDLDLIISQKEATMYGVPIQVYFFSRNKVWKEYERIQSDIFDHLLAMVPKFDLKVYQYSD